MGRQRPARVRLAARLDRLLPACAPVDPLLLQRVQPPRPGVRRPRHLPVWTADLPEHGTGRTVRVLSYQPVGDLAGRVVLSFSRAGGGWLLSGVPETPRLPFGNSHRTRFRPRGG